VRNPLTLAKHGIAEGNAALDSDALEKVDGIKLLGISF
jgi:hypothetical protein